MIFLSNLPASFSSSLQKRLQPSKPTISSAPLAWYKLVCERRIGDVSSILPCTALTLANTELSN